MKKTGRVTLLDVASEAGVSRATCSLVVRNSPLVADATRAHVLDTMGRLGYVYNRAAASLRTNASRTIGLLIPDIGNPYFAELTHGVQEALDPTGRAAFLSSSGESVQRQQKLMQRFLEAGVDGVIICPAHGSRRSDFSLLESSGLPIVFVSRWIRGAHADYIGADNVHGGREAVKHLMLSGKKQIVFFGGEAGSSARSDRLKGVQTVLGDARMVLCESFECPPTRHAARDLLLRVYPDMKEPDAIIGYNDVVAFGIMDALVSLGCKVGHNCAVVGFDGVEEAGHVRPGLTTVAVPPESVGFGAVELLDRRLSATDKKPQSRKKVLLRGELIVRDSSCASE